MKSTSTLPQASMQNVNSWGIVSFPICISSEWMPCSIQYEKSEENSTSC
uniref:Uncharacterized protein n=1 Tax=Manihot esculenta TaxID=3983 RepID=A0A2C9WNN6_MANES